MQIDLIGRKVVDDTQVGALWSPDYDKNLIHESVRSATMVTSIP